MAVALPTGYDAAEAQAIFAALSAQGDQVANTFLAQTLPVYLNPTAFQGAPLPAAVDQTEFNAIMNDISTKAGVARDSYIVTHTPKELIPNIVDYVVPTDPATSSWLAAVLAKGAPVSSTYMAAVNTLINTLKTAGVFQRLDRLWLFGAENATQALVDLIGANAATAVNAPTFTPGKGFQGNGTSSYINTGYNPATAGGKFIVNDACHGVWIDAYNTGGHVLANENGIYSRLAINSSGQREVEVQASASAAVYTPGSTVGFTHGQRTGASAAANFGQGGVVDQIPNNAGAGFLSNRIYFALANNYPGPTTPINFANSRLSAVWMGGSMTQAQLTAFATALATFFTTAGQVNAVDQWQTAVVNQGGSVTPQRLQMIKDLLYTPMYNAGVWQKLDNFFIFAAESAVQALTDLIGGRNATAVNSPAFTPNRGYQGNGTSSYVNSNQVQQYGPNYTQNSATMGAWVDINATINAMCGNNDSAYSEIYFTTGPIGRAININSNAGGPAYATNFPTGFQHFQRTGPTQLEGYGGPVGVQEYLNAAAPTSFAPNSAGTMGYIALGWNAGAGARFSTARLSAGWCGGALTASQIAVFAKAMTTFMQAVVGAYEFDLAAALPSGVTLSRAGTGYYVNSSGFLASAAANAARFQYDGTPALLGLLNEPAGTNLALQSNTFSNATWAKSRCSIGAAVTGPDNVASSAVPLVEDATATNSHVIAQNTTATAGRTYCASIYAKANTRTWLTIFAAGGFFGHPSTRQVYFNLSTGAIGSAGVPDNMQAGVQTLANGWRRIWVSAVCSQTGGAAGYFTYGLANADNGSTYTGDGASSAYIYGAQIEDITGFAGPSSYIPTTTAAASRAADIVTVVPPATGVFDVIEFCNPSIGSTGQGAQSLNVAVPYTIPTNNCPVQRVTFVPAVATGVDTDAWAAQVQANGGAVTQARRQLIHQFIRAEIQAGNWALTDDYWITAAEGQVQALTSLKQRVLAVNMNSTTFVQDRHFAGDGNTTYINTQMRPNVHMTLGTFSNCRMDGYCRNNLADTRYLLGTYVSSSQNFGIIPRHFSTNNVAGYCTYDGAGFLLNPQDSRGHTAISRAGSAQAGVLGFKNGQPAPATGYPTVYGTSISYVPLFLLTLNNAGNPNASGSYQIAFASVGAPLTPAQELARYNAVQNHMTAIGAQV